MRVLSLGILTVFVLAMDPIFISALPGWSARPNVLLVPLAVAVMRWPGPLAVVWGGLIGLCCDCLSGPVLGPQMALFALLAAVGTFFIPQRPLTSIEILLFSFGFLFIGLAFSSLVKAWFSGPSPGSATGAGAVAGAALTTALLISVFWVAGRRLLRRAGGGRRRARGASRGWQIDGN